MTYAIHYATTGCYMHAQIDTNQMDAENDEDAIKEALTTQWEGDWTITHNNQLVAAATQIRRLKEAGIICVAARRYPKQTLTIRFYVVRYLLDDGGFYSATEINETTEPNAGRAGRKTS
jgi:hypothetical protein